MAKITNASEWIDWWNERAADSPVLEKHYRGPGYCDRCAHKYTSGIVEYCINVFDNDLLGVFVCPRCNDLYDVKMNTFPRVEDEERAWLLLSLSGHT